MTQKHREALKKNLAKAREAKAAKRQAGGPSAAPVAPSKEVAEGMNPCPLPSTVRLSTSLPADESAKPLVSVSLRQIEAQLGRLTADVQELRGRLERLL